MAHRTPATGARKARTTTVQIGSVVVSRLLVSYLQDRSLHPSTRSTPPAWCDVRVDVWRDALLAVASAGVGIAHPPEVLADGTPAQRWYGTLASLRMRTLAHWRKGVVRLADHYRRRVQYARRGQVVATTPARIEHGCALRRKGAPRRSPRVVGEGVHYTPTQGVVWVARTPDAPPDATPATERLTKAQRAELARLARIEAKAQRRALRATSAPAPAPAPERADRMARRRVALIERVLNVVCGVNPDGTPSRNAREVEALALSHPILAHRLQGLVQRLSRAQRGSGEDYHLSHCMTKVCAVGMNPPALVRLLADLPIVS